MIARLSPSYGSGTRHRSPLESLPPLPAVYIDQRLVRAGKAASMQRGSNCTCRGAAGRRPGRRCGWWRPPAPPGPGRPGRPSGPAACSQCCCGSGPAGCCVPALMGAGQGPTAQQRAPASAPAAQAGRRRRHGTLTGGPGTAAPGRPHRGKAINLVKEDDGGLAALSLCKQGAQLPLSLSHPLGQDVRPLAHEEGHRAPRPTRAGCQRPRHQGLAGACPPIAARRQLVTHGVSTEPAT